MSETIVEQGFVRDMAKRALERGSGVCVMIARGLMGTPLNGFGESCSASRTKFLR